MSIQKTTEREAILDEAICNSRRIPVIDLVPLYSVGTWDTYAQAYTPQIGLSKSFNLTRAELKTAIRELRAGGYSVHRYGNTEAGHDNNDTAVLIERTDGVDERDIREQWKR